MQAGWRRVADRPLSVVRRDRSKSLTILRYATSTNTNGNCRRPMQLKISKVGLGIARAIVALMATSALGQLAGQWVAGNSRRLCMRFTEQAMQQLLQGGQYAWAKRTLGREFADLVGILVRQAKEFGFGFAALGVDNRGTRRAMPGMGRGHCRRGTRRAVDGRAARGAYPVRCAGHPDPRGSRRPRGVLRRFPPFSVH